MSFGAGSEPRDSPNTVARYVRLGAIGRLSTPGTKEGHREVRRRGRGDPRSVRPDRQPAVIVTEGRSHRLIEAIEGRGVARLEATEP